MSKPKIIKGGGTTETLQQKKLREERAEAEKKFKESIDFTQLSNEGRERQVINNKNNIPILKLDSSRADQGYVARGSAKPSAIKASASEPGEYLSGRSYDGPNQETTIGDNIKVPLYKGDKNIEFRTRQFDQARQKLLATTNTVNFVSVVAAEPNGYEFGAMAQRTATSVKFTEQKLPADADDYIWDTKEVVDNSNLHWKTSAVINIKDLSEARKHIKEKENKVITDMIIAVHGHDNSMGFIDETGKWRNTTLDSPELYGFFKELQKSGLLLPGANVMFSSCSVANSEAAKKNLQFIADKFGIKILASPDIVYSGSPLIDFIAFLPESVTGQVRQVEEYSEDGKYVTLDGVLEYLRDREIVKDGKLSFAENSLIKSSGAVYWQFLEGEKRTEIPLWDVPTMDVATDMLNRYGHDVMISMNGQMRVIDLEKFRKLIAQKN